MDDQSEERKRWLSAPENVAKLLPAHIRIDERLAIGGQGVVFRGWVNEDAAAIKVYFPGNMERRVEREVTALRSLDCYSIVKLLWSDIPHYDHTEFPIVATSYINGSPLDQLLRGRPLRYEELGILAYDVATAVDHLWRKRLVHRDLKPSNILINENGRACVIDLGVARHLDQSTLTSLAGAVWGTLGYLSPEQAKGIRVLTCRSDIFALGVILIECALGYHPAQHNQQRLFDKDLHETLPDEISHWKHANLLKKMLWPQAAKRPMPEVIISDFVEYASANIKE